MLARPEWRPSAERTRRRVFERVLRPVRPSAALEADYRRQLLRLVDEMTASVDYWVRAAYRANPPALAQDATPAEELRAAVAELAARWTTRFDAMSESIARRFAERTESRSTAALRKMFREAGWTVRFVRTPAMRDVIDATVQANVSLIRSIPSKFFGEIEGIVMRGVQNGRDLRSVSEALRARFGVTRRRAALIARDQNNKATSALWRARMLETGVDEAIWVHSHGGREPRPTHVKAGQDRVRYKISEGWYDPHEKRHIQPGELINCRCVGRPVIRGFS